MILPACIHRLDGSPRLDESAMSAAEGVPLIPKSGEGVILPGALYRKVVEADSQCAVRVPSAGPWQTIWCRLPVEANRWAIGPRASRNSLTGSPKVGCAK